MSGPKTSSYDLDLQRIRRMNRLRTETENLENALYVGLSELAAFHPEQAVQVRQQLGTVDWEDESSLRAYQQRLAQAGSAIETARDQIRKQSESDFSSRMGKLVDGSQSHLESIDDMLEQIASANTADGEEALDMLATLGVPQNCAEEELAGRLKSVVATAARLDPDLRADAEKILAGRDTQTAGKIAVEALEDLGYEVGGDFSTLFVEGGMMHFQKAEWGDYFVRMRVDTEEQFINFNMVRVGEQDWTAERKTCDREMEQSWCREYPKLLNQLREMGIQCGQMRALDAGAVAVQVVKPVTVGRLDDTAATEARRSVKIRERSRER